MATVRRSPVIPSTRRTIGVLAPVVGGFYFGGLIAGMARAARRAGHRVVALQTYPAGLDRERYPDEPLLEVPAALGAVDGVIIVATAVRHDRLAAVQDWGLPLVLVSEEQPSLPVPVVIPDNAGGVRAAVEHLLGHGHTRIGFVGNPVQRDIRERYQAYRDTLSTHGLHAESSWFLETSDNHEPGGADAATRLLAAGSPTTATIVATDRNAMGFLRTLRTSGLVLPRDHAVIGFDHTEGGARLIPRLSTVDPHYDRVGELAVGLLLAGFRGENVPAEVHRSPSTLVTRESCGCGDVSAPEVDDADATAGPVRGTTRARARVARLSDIALGGPSASASSRYLGREARDAWWRGVVDPIATAAERGLVPSSTSLGRLADLTSTLRPHPEALEQMVAAVRDLEAEHMTARLSAVRKSALRTTSTEVLLALAKGCTRPLLARSGYLERVIADQYEIDLDLLHGRSPSPRALTWLPRGFPGPACLGLWIGSGRAPGDREIEIVGVNDTSGALSRLIGLRTRASEFPPAALTHAGGVGSPEVTFVIPVTFAGSDWGLLAINGMVETRATSSRDKYNHWAALLAVALDQERLVSNLREQRKALEDAASRERALADTVRASEERYALASMATHDGTWDWDVSAGTVYYSPSWKRMLGYRAGEIGSSPSEWFDRTHPDDRDALSAAIAAQLGGAHAPLELEHRVRTASGDHRWMLCRAVTVLDDAGCPARLVGALVDMTERKERELALRRSALRDPETGLATRMLFLDRLGAAVTRSRRSDAFDCAVVLLRVISGRASTRFGLDEMLDPNDDGRLEVVHRLRRALQDGDSAARLGQDQFAVLLDDVGVAGAQHRADELMALVRSDLGFTVAIGVLASIAPFHDADDALREAEIALLRAQSQPESWRRSVAR